MMEGQEEGRERRNRRTVVRGEGIGKGREARGKGMNGRRKRMERGTDGGRKSGRKRNRERTITSTFQQVISSITFTSFYIFHHVIRKPIHMP